MSGRPKIFLSHRHVDKEIADVVRRHLGIWGFDDIYQSSAPGHGPQAGENINDEIKHALYEAKLVVLIYTLNDSDWAYCMWECGLATHPKNSDTKTIVIQCNPHDTPKTFEGQLLVKVERDSLKNFIIQFHQHENFLPGVPAIRPGISVETIADFSNDFYDDLYAIIPPGQLEERNRWDSLALQLTKAELEEIKKDSAQEARNKIVNQCRVVRSFGSALKHFGYVNLEPEMKLADLVTRWTDETKDRENFSDNWINELSDEIYRALNNSPANPEWKILDSVNFPGSFFYPVVNHARILADGSMEFDVFFFCALAKRPKLIVEKHTDQVSSEKVT